MNIIKRYAGNPILTRRDVPYPVATVYNAAVVKQSGSYTMLFRSNLLNGRSIIGIADSSDGFHFVPREHPFLVPCPDGFFGVYEEYGVEDPRITRLEDYYYITYSVYSRYGVRNALARTTDFQHVEKIALITQADMRNVVLFPEKIKGLYVRLDRPHADINPWGIWISYSPDLIHWGNSRIVIKPLHYHWDEMKIGPGAPPIKTKEGWLHIFHGSYPNINTTIYRLGAALHDIEDPSRVIGVADEWILQPEEIYETSGYVPNVVFCCASVPEEDGTLKIYWGGADEVMCVGTCYTEELIHLCREKGRAPL